MPKSNKKGAKKNSCDVASDFKLSDFADCSSQAGRIRKSLDKNVADIFKTEEISWYERDLEEFNLLEIASENRKKQLKGKTPFDESLTTPGNNYPIDVWFLIGQFIKPEDVILFASICKDSYYVSRTYSFWVRMYKRHYQPDVPLPTRLQPDCIEQSFCLKPCVIRALYLMYPRFSSQIPQRPSSPDVHCLSNLCCALMWRLPQEGGKWLFQFKFRSTSGASSGSSSSLNYRVAIKDWWTHQELTNQDVYVNHNPNDGCKVLRFETSHFVAVPLAVMGSRLSEVRVNLAHDMRRQKLQLTFSHSSYRQYNNKDKLKDRGSGEVVEFDAVENLMVLDWWHPQYPCDDKV